MNVSLIKSVADDIKKMGKIEVQEKTLQYTMFRPGYVSRLDKLDV